MREMVAGGGAPIAVVVADDLTGAADTAAGFAVQGLTTVVRLAEEPRQVSAMGADVVAIDMATRAGDAALARSRAAQFVEAVRALGVRHVYKKCDSLLRGHIGGEAAGAVAAWGPGALAIAALAFPDAGRTTADGLQRISGRDAGLPIAPLFERAGLRTRLIGLDAIRTDDLNRALCQARADRVEVVVCDAVRTADLAAIVGGGLALGSPIVWVGTGGLARALAHAIAPARAGGVGAAPRDALQLRRVGPVLIVCGSRSGIAREQVRRVVDAGAALIEVPADTLLAEDEHADRRRIVDRIESILAGGRDAVVALAPPAGDDPNEAFALRVASALGQMLAPFAEQAAGVAATGGDTATAVLRAWGATSLWLSGEVEPGIAVSIAAGRHEFAVVTKAGAFGGPDALVRARSRLHTMIHDAADTA